MILNTREENLIYQNVLSHEPKGIDVNTLIFEIAIYNQMYSSKELLGTINDLISRKILLSVTIKINDDEMIILNVNKEQEVRNDEFIYPHKLKLVPNASAEFIL